MNGEAYCKQYSYYKCLHAYGWPSCLCKHRQFSVQTFWNLWTNIEFCAKKNTKSFCPNFLCYCLGLPLQYSLHSSLLLFWFVFEHDLFCMWNFSKFMNCSSSSCLFLPQTHLQLLCYAFPFHHWERRFNVFIKMQHEYDIIRALRVAFFAGKSSHWRCTRSCNCSDRWVIDIDRRLGGPGGKGDEN